MHSYRSITQGYRTTLLKSAFKKCIIKLLFHHCAITVFLWLSPAIPRGQRAPLQRTLPACWPGRRPPAQCCQRSSQTLARTHRFRAGCISAPTSVRRLRCRCVWAWFCLPISVNTARAGGSRVVYSSSRGSTSHPGDPFLDPTCLTLSQRTNLG